MKQATITATESKDTIQFTGYIDGKPVVMSIPELDDGEELCEFPGYQAVSKCVGEMAA